jgi:ring-1,2-phenylacetyl-CoA epoxidase subunit PaaC
MQQSPISSTLNTTQIVASTVSSSKECKEAFLLHLADTTLILAQQQTAWCGHGPILEQDIAISNVSLDLLGQSRNFYQHAATLIGNNTDEDKLAYLRTEREFKNLLLVEQPNGDWGQTVLRLFFFSQFQYLLFEQLQANNDEQLAAICTKALKEIKYHIRWSSEWVIRLGDGTEQSKQRMLSATNFLWPYTGEMFVVANYEKELNINWDELKLNWQQKVFAIFSEATLPIPENTFMQIGGKNGVHTEQLGFILTELQYLQRTYPNSQW